LRHPASDPKSLPPENKIKYYAESEINVKKPNLIFLLPSILTENLVTASNNNNILFSKGRRTCG
jgi:hypothetical protein